MKKLRKLLEKWTCQHKWEKVDEKRVFEEDGWTGKISDMPRYYKQLWICRECGKMKRIKT